MGSSQLDNGHGEHLGRYEVLKEKSGEGIPILSEKKVVLFPLVQNALLRIFKLAWLNSAHESCTFQLDFQHFWK